MKARAQFFGLSGLAGAVCGGLGGWLVPALLFHGMLLEALAVAVLAAIALVSSARTIGRERAGREWQAEFDRLMDEAREQVAAARAYAAEVRVPFGGGPG